MLSSIYVFHPSCILYVFKLWCFSTLPKQWSWSFVFYHTLMFFFIKNDFFLDHTIMPARCFFINFSIFLSNYKVCRQTLPSVQCPWFYSCSPSFHAHALEGCLLVLSITFFVANPCISFSGWSIMWSSSCKKHWYKLILSVILSSFEQELTYIGAHSPFHSSYWPLLLLLLPVHGGLSVQVNDCLPHSSPCLSSLLTHLFTFCNHWFW
jgi:hypothetical protein